MVARRVLLSVLASAGMVLAGCGGGNDDSGNTDLTPAQAEAVGQAAVGQVGGLASGFTHFNTPDVGGLGAGFFAPRAAGSAVLVRTMSRLDPRIAHGVAHINADNCTPSQSSVTDTDNDGIPDDDTITFSAANCTFPDTTDQGVPVTVVVTGTVRLQDTDGATVFYGYHVGVTGFTVTVADSQGNSGVTRVNGIYDVSVANDQATTSENITSSLSLNGSRLYGDHTTLVVAYLPTGGSISPSATQLPAGDLTLTGGYTWSGQLGQVSGNWGFVLDTPIPLHYDGACSDPEFVFASGQLKGAINLRQTVGFQVDYGGCGVEPTVTVFRPV